MEAWRSHCPRHTVWEDATIDGLVEVAGDRVDLTALGRSALRYSTTFSPLRQER